MIMYCKLIINFDKKIKNLYINNQLKKIMGVSFGGPKV